jgi:uncharacterized protein (TIGR00251 family)
MHIKVKVTPDAKKEKLIMLSENSFKISVKEKAKDGKANQKVMDILKEILKPRPKKLKLVVGHTSPSKIFEVEY